MTILDEILARKSDEVAAAKQLCSEQEMAQRASRMSDAPRGFRRALLESPAPAVIAELKRRSPSKGEIRPGFEPVECARAYAEGGAAALSVLTDEYYFGGHLDYLVAVRREVSLPLLRKDFTVDAYQIDEARVAGADCVLLMASALEPDELKTLRERAISRDLDVLVEVHDEEELEVALAAQADLIGINNRDLHTFDVDLATTERIAKRLEGRLVAGASPAPAGGDGIVLVAESGIHTHRDIARLERVGAAAFLVGESLMRERDLVAALGRLRKST